jgi:hypothetical protein
MPKFCLSLARGPRALRILVVATTLGAAAAAHAQGTAVFTLSDQTNLTPGTYQIYVTGFSTGGPYVLQQDGSWATPATTGSGTATLPCYRFSPGVTPQPSDAISQVQINGTQTAISGRVYYFIVTDTTRFPGCNPASGAQGLFNQQGVTNGFTYTYTTAAGMAVTAPTTTNVIAKNFPAWTYSEIGASSTTGTIDLSQVDFFAFPMNTTAAVAATTPPALANPSVIGNPLGTANPSTVVNQQSIRDSFRAFINARAQAKNANKPCSVDSTPIECAYLDLLQDITTTGSAVPQYVLQNPGGFLTQNTSTTQASRLNNVFDGVVSALWSGLDAPTLVLDTGGALGGAAAAPPAPAIPAVPEDVFTSAQVVVNYPGSTYPVHALKFTGTATSGNYVAYVFSPADYATGCQGGQIPSTYCQYPISTGFQVFAAGGALGAPIADTYTQLLNAGLLSPTASSYQSLGYNAVAARLAFLVSGALNRGVTMVQCPQATWTCWQDETYWYPTSVSSGTPPLLFPDITQNLFSQWIHTAKVGGTPMFVRPPGALRAATSVPGAGKIMGMAYGFSNDENSTPVVPSPPAATSPQPEVPSKFDSSVTYGGTASAYTITFGPWVTPAGTNPTLTVINDPKAGTVTSSPGDIDCGTTCGQSYPVGTQVTLTAVPAKDFFLWKWEGGCTGSSTTCSLTLSTTTTVKVYFATAASPAPAGYVLTTIVNGAGSVASTPAGIDCGSACSKSFNANTLVTLTATAASGSAFAGWSGACSGTALTCAVTMSQARNVGASFAGVAQRTLSVTGATGGTVVSTPTGIDCGTRCIAAFDAGVAVSVAARPQPGYRFGGWSGACSGMQTCDLAMDANRSVQAAFVPVPAGQYALTVHDYGEGTIQSSPAGIACGTTCSAAFPANTEVTLIATPKAGYQFAGWTGACTGTGSCVLFMEDLASVSAFFTPIAGGGGGGTVPGQPIPTLSEWALILMSLLVVFAAAPSLRRLPARARRRD